MFEIIIFSVKVVIIIMLVVVERFFMKVNVDSVIFLVYKGRVSIYVLEFVFIGSSIFFVSVIGIIKRVMLNK